MAERAHLTVRRADDVFDSLLFKPKLFVFLFGSLVFGFLFSQEVDEQVDGKCCANAINTEAQVDPRLCHGNAANSAFWEIKAIHRSLLPCSIGRRCLYN